MKYSEYKFTSMPRFCILKACVMKVEEELMHTQCQCLMKASFLLDVRLVILTLKTKPLSPSVGSSKSISGYGGEEKYSMIQKDGLNFVCLYFLNYTWYVNDLHNF